MKLKCPLLQNMSSKKNQQNYWSFHPSEPFTIAHFNVRHPVPLLDHSMVRLGKEQAIWKSEWIFCLYNHIINIFFSNFRSISATTTIWSFNGEIRQRTSNTWRLQQWWLSSQDLLNDLFQQELHHIVTGQRTLSSKRFFCGNSHTRHNVRMHHRR